MKATNKLYLEIVTQEKPILKVSVDQISVPTTTGEVTILPGHIGLFTRLDEGVISYLIDGQESYLILFGGFMDVAPSGKVTVLADAAVRAEEIDIAKVEKAKESAEKRMKEDIGSQDYLQAQSSLRRAYQELRAHKIIQSRKMRSSRRSS